VVYWTPFGRLRRNTGLGDVRPRRHNQAAFSKTKKTPDIPKCVVSAMRFFWELSALRIAALSSFGFLT
jgi:hypothetical protein